MRLQKNIGGKSHLGGNFGISVAKFRFFQIKRDEFAYLQFLYEENDVLGSEKLLADDFASFDVSVNPMVIMFCVSIAGVVNGVESSRTETKGRT